MQEILVFEMSKAKQKEKLRMADEPGRVLRKDSGPSRKESTVNDIVEKAVKNQLPKQVKKYVKRKIDFSNDETQPKQSNNNATVVNLNENKDSQVKLTKLNGSKDLRNGNKMKTRSSAPKIVPDVSSRVQWIQEFLNKVRKSNEKFLNNKKERAVSINSISLQERDTGDGVSTNVEMEVLEEEELDYDDDLSFEEEGKNLDSANSSNDDAVLPSTSTAGKEPLELIDCDEEKLMNNPVIQRMMEKFLRTK